MVFCKTLQEIKKILGCIKHPPLILFKLPTYYFIIGFLEFNAQFYIFLFIPHFQILTSETFKQLIPNTFHGFIWPPVDPINSTLAYQLRKIPHLFSELVKRIHCYHYMHVLLYFLDEIVIWLGVFSTFPFALIEYLVTNFFDIILR